MSYGLEVFNGDGLTILNSSEGLSTLIKINSNTISSSSSYPVNFPTGIDATNLFFVQPTASIFVSEFHFNTVTRQIYRSGTSGLDWIEAGNTQGNFSSGFDTGYGLNVFDGTGTAAADLLFSSNTSQSIDIVAVGAYADLGANTSLQININSSTPHYVLINGSHYGFFNVVGFGSFENKRGYEYTYAADGTTISNIKIISTQASYLTSGTVPAGGDMAYMIIKLRG